MREKLRTFIRDPWGSVRRRGEYTLFSRRARRFWARQPELAAFLQRRPSDAIAPDYADLWFLYRAVRQRKPRQILEFGSGCSTVAMSLALRANRSEGSPPGQLASIDSMEHWTEINRKAMPAGLQDFCQILFSPLEETHWGLTPCFRHRKIPEVYPDFVYLDGPVLTSERRVAVDVLELEDRFQPGFLLVVDGRWENAMFLRAELQRRYRFEYRTLYQNSTFELLSEDDPRVARVENMGDVR